jgi:hypothetical protein
MDKIVTKILRPLVEKNSILKPIYCYMRGRFRIPTECLCTDRCEGTPQISNYITNSALRADIGWATPTCRDGEVLYRERRRYEKYNKRIYA